MLLTFLDEQYNSQVINYKQRSDCWWELGRGIEARRKRLLYKSYHVISRGSRWGELCSFSLHNFKRLCKLGKHPLSFSQGQLDPDSPTQAYLTVTDEAVCRGVGRWMGGGGGRESQKHPGGTDSLASAGCQSALATPRPGAASVSTHFHTWTNSSTGQEKQPTHPPIPTSFPVHLLLFHYLGHHQLPSDTQSFFSFISDPSLCHCSCPQLAVYIYSFCLTPISWNIVCYVMYVCYLAIIYLSFFSQHLVCMVNACIWRRRKNKKNKTKTLHYGFEGVGAGGGGYTALSNMRWLLIGWKQCPSTLNDQWNLLLCGCGPEVDCVSDHCLTEMITTERDDRDKMTVLTHSR